MAPGGSDAVLKSESEFASPVGVAVPNPRKFVLPSIVIDPVPMVRIPVILASP